MVDTRADYPNPKYARRQHNTNWGMFAVDECEAKSFSVKKSLNRAVPAVWTLLLR